MAHRPRHVIAVVIVVAAIATALAQHAGGSLSGTVTDDTGAVLPGVQVVATLESDDSISRTVTTDAEGRFRIADVPFGTYRLEYTLPGFVQVVRRAVRLAPGMASSASVVLSSASASAPRAKAAPPRLPPPPPPPPQPSLALPPPSQPDRAPAAAAPAAPASPSVGMATIPVFYATDRLKTADDVPAFSGDRNAGGRLHLGRFDVSVPRDHQMGEVERPNIWTLWTEDQGRHFVITNRKLLSYDQFYSGIREVVGRSPRKEAFVFIHGFNVAFEDAIYRTAQLAYDLAFDGAPILYSWPSVGAPTLTGYTTDAGNNDWTVPHLRWFLEDVARRTGAMRIHLIAHSMGNKALVNALDHMPGSSTRRFTQIVLTAPDIDAATFVQLADAVRRNGEAATLYASSNDKALKLSKELQRYRRAGDTSDGVVVVPGIDTIDVSAVDTNFLGHSYYGSNDSVLADLFLLLSQGLKPAQRPRLRRNGSAPNQFWVFAR